ncbi:MAG: sigma-70 family RNA polymerase sigma factor [Eubacteriales bacterium]|nr:sigma-70 family RNA polymerase sigma factor [Eubacteriales bacterium]
MDADKKQIWMNGQLIEVTEEVYAAYQKGDRKMRYFEKDLKTERFLLDENGQLLQVIPSREDSLDRLMADNAEQFADQHESVEDQVFRRISMEQLYEALQRLTNTEQNLIYALFFEEQTESQVGEILGITQQAVHRQKTRLLKKLKNFLEK